MTTREDGGRRRQQIADAALALLATLPLDQLTTRRIAAEVGLSQPALFRHFRSREAIILAVIAAARAELSTIGESILATLDDPVEQLTELACRIAAHIERNPGLPRLIFLLPEPGPIRTALSVVVTMQASLVRELVREGQRRGSLRPDADPADAATLFVGLIQGLALGAQLDPQMTGLASRARASIGLWLDGMRRPAATAGDGAATEVEASASGIAALDVRPLLAGGLDPLDAILDTLGGLERSAVLVITAPFLPRPLLALLASRGHAVEAGERMPGVWSVTVVVGGDPVLVDLTKLEPPEPLERVLSVAAELPAGATFVARLPRYPQLLVGRLQAAGRSFVIHRDVDDSAILRLRGEA